MSRYEVELVKLLEQLWAARKAAEATRLDLVDRAIDYIGELERRSRGWEAKYRARYFAELHSFEQLAIFPKRLLRGLRGQRAEEAKKRWKLAAARHAALSAAAPAIAPPSHVLLYNAEDFCAAAVIDLTLMVTRGQPGAPESWRTKRRKFGTQAAAEGALKQLVADETARGFEEHSLPLAVESLLAPLAQDPGYQKLAECIAASAITVTKQRGSRSLVFWGGDERLYDFVLTPRERSAPLPDWPASFRQLAQRYQAIALSRHGKNDELVVLADIRNLEPEFLEEAGLSAAVARTVRCPILRGPDWFVYHPSKRNAAKEPALSFFSHEGGGLGAPEPMRVGSALLRLICDAAEIDHGQRLKSGRGFWAAR